MVFRRDGVMHFTQSWHQDRDAFLLLRRVRRGHRTRHQGRYTKGSRESKDFHGGIILFEGRSTALLFLVLVELGLNSVFDFFVERRVVSERFFPGIASLCQLGPFVA